MGSITGTVAIEGKGIAGVAVSLSNGEVAATAPTGIYRFDQLEGGSYTVSISGYPLDATFEATSVSAEIASNDQTVIVDFRGEYVRTASLMGRVSIDGRSAAGVSVLLAGMSESLTVTDEFGLFGFESLRAGSYSVSISDFGEAEFPTTIQSVSLAVGESRVLSFEGSYIPDLTGTYDLISLSALVTGGRVLKHPDVSGTFSLRQSPPVGDQASGTMSMSMTMPDGLGGTQEIIDTGTYIVRRDGTWEQTGQYVQARGRYTLVGDTLAVEITEPALNVSSTVWRRVSVGGIGLNEAAVAWPRRRP